MVGKMKNYGIENGRENLKIYKKINTQNK